MEPLQTRSDSLIGPVQKGGPRQTHIIFDHRNDASALETFTDKDLPAVGLYYFEQHQSRPALVTTVRLFRHDLMNGVRRKLPTHRSYFWRSTNTVFRCQATNSAFGAKRSGDSMGRPSSGMRTSLTNTSSQRFRSSEMSILNSSVRVINPLSKARSCSADRQRPLLGFSRLSLS